MITCKVFTNVLTDTVYPAFASVKFGGRPLPFGLDPFTEVEMYTVLPDVLYGSEYWTSP
jgi:hypothetical protein